MVDRRLQLHSTLITLVQSYIWLGENFDTLEDLRDYTLSDIVEEGTFTFVLSDENHDNQCSMYVVVENITNHTKAFSYTCERVYFQPPEKQLIQYPCIIYSLSDISATYADNRIYRSNNVYQIILVDENPDSMFVALILSTFEAVKFDRFYVSDSLNHWAFTLNY